MGSNSSRYRNSHWTTLVVASLTNMALARPALFLLLACIITLGGTIYSALTLQFRTSRLDLLDTRAEYNQRWLHYLELFGKQDDGIVLIEGADPQRVSQALLDVGTTLEKDNRFSGVLFHSAVPQLADKRLHLAPTQSLESLSQLLQLMTFAASPTVNTNNPTENTPRVDTLNKTLTQPVFRPSIPPLVQQWNQLLNAHAIPLLTLELNALDQFLSDPTQPPTAGVWQQVATATRDTMPPPENSLLLDDEGRIGLCLMSLQHPDDAPQEVAAEQKALRELITIFETRYPDLKFYFTGMPVLEADEGQSTQNDMLVASVVSMVGVVIMLIIAYGSLRMPILAMIALLFGLLWTLTFATAAIGHLNLLSAAFGAILIGLGIDFSIHYLSHFLTTAPEPNHREDTIKAQLLSTSRHCGVGICVGAISTAAAFGCAAVTPFKGISELGVISGGGTLLCALAALTTLPAMLLIYLDRKRNRSGTASAIASPSESKRSNLIAYGLSKISNFAISQPRVVLIATCVLLFFAAPAAYRSRFDHNLLNLQADGLPSVAAENILIERSSHSTWYAISLAPTPQQAEQLAERFRRLPTVARVDHAASLITSQDDATKQAVLKKLAQLIDPLQQMVRGGYSAHTDLESLQTWLNRSLPMIQGTSLAPLCVSLEQKLNRIPPDEFAALMRQYEIARQSTSLYILQQLKTLVEAEAPTIKHLPDGIRDRLWHDSGIFQLRIFPKGNVWDREPLERFIKDLESIDPKVTGHPVQTYYASGELQASYYSASLYALIAVSILLLLNFGNPLHVLAAMLPALLGLVSLLALMTWFDTPLNPANMIALPLVLGIGVDDGVHLTDQFRQRRWRVGSAIANSESSDSDELDESLETVRPAYTIEPGTNLAILLTSVSTMLGFGSLMVAHHRGLFSLGWVLTVGIGLCWLFSVSILPALFSALVQWENKSRRSKRTRRTTRRSVTRGLN